MFNHTVPQKRRLVMPILMAIGLCCTHACTPYDDHEYIRDPILRMSYILRSGDSTESPVIFFFEDADSDGGMAPLLVDAELRPNTTYKGELELHYRSEEMKHSIIRQNIHARPTQHQVFYTVSDTSAMHIVYADTDSLGNPLGIRTRVTTGDTANLHLTITILYDLDKFAEGVNRGDMSNAKGEVDMAATFGATIE
jgi:hypothetical protein